MRSLLVLTLAMLLVTIFAEVSFTAPDAPAVGRLHRIDVSAKHPKAYQPHVGDLLQCYADFPIVPGKILEGLEVVVAGTSVAATNVVSTSKVGIIGTGQISAFFVPRHPGKATITLRAVNSAEKTKAVTLTVLVRPARER